MVLPKERCVGKINYFRSFFSTKLYPDFSVFADYFLMFIWKSHYSHSVWLTVISEFARHMSKNCQKVFMPRQIVWSIILWRTATIDQVEL